MLLLDPASGRFDLLSCASAHLHAANCHSARNLAICEYFRRAFSPMNQADFDESLRRHFHSFGQSAQIVQPNNLMLNAKDIREPALWQPSGKRHLSALELRLATPRPVMARASFDSLVTLA
jgi:hypothetical protein